MISGHRHSFYPPRKFNPLSGVIAFIDYGQPRKAKSLSSSEINCTRDRDDRDDILNDHGSSLQFSKVGRSVKGGGRTAIGFRKETCFVKSNSFPSRNFILLFFSTNTLYEFASNLREIFSFHPRDETISKKFQPAFFPSSRDEIFARRSAGEERIADFCREIPPRFRKKNRGCVRGQCGSTALIIMGKVPRKENVHLCRLFS